MSKFKVGDTVIDITDGTYCTIDMVSGPELWGIWYDLKTNIPFDQGITDAYAYEENCVPLTELAKVLYA